METEAPFSSVDYSRWCVVAYNRMPWKRHMYQSYKLSRDGPQYSITKVRNNYVSMYIHVAVQRFRMPPSRGLKKIDRWLELSAHMQRWTGP